MPMLWRMVLYCYKISTPKLLKARSSVKQSLIIHNKKGALGSDARPSGLVVLLGGLGHGFGNRPLSKHILRQPTGVEEEASSLVKISPTILLNVGIQARATEYSRPDQSNLMRLCCESPQR